MYSVIIVMWTVSAFTCLRLFKQKKQNLVLLETFVKKKNKNEKKRSLLDKINEILPTDTNGINAI